MKIATVLPSLAHRGPIIVARDIIHGLQSLTNDVSFSVYYFDDIRELNIDANCKRISFIEQINFDKYDLIHSHGLRPDSYIFLNKGSINIPSVSTLHNYMEADFKYRYGNFTSYFFSKIWRFALKSHSKLAVLSDDMKNYYSRYYPADKVITIYNGRNVEGLNGPKSDNDLNKVERLKQKYTLLGINAHATYVKGIDQVIDFLGKCDTKKEYCLVLLGYGKAIEDLKSKVRKYGIEDRVFFLGYKENILDYLRLYDIYMMPSRSEGFGLALIEASSVKKAIVCSDINIFEELFNADEVSFFELENIESLSKAIAKASLNKDKLGEAAYKKYKKSFTVEAMAKKYLDLFESLANG